MGENTFASAFDQRWKSPTSAASTPNMVAMTMMGSGEENSSMMSNLSLPTTASSRASATSTTFGFTASIARALKAWVTRRRKRA